MHRSFSILLAMGLLGACNPPVDTSTDTSTTDTSDTSDTGTAAVTEVDCSSITADHTVDMQGIAYNPDTLTIGVGETVEWTNSDSVTHTVTSGVPGAPDGVFDSGNIGAGETYCLQFDTAASYDYFCTIHQSAMTASLTVQ